ncbi:uncharacterized protein LOC127838976 isoform X2 [Dreissena polymorpha]|uniref:uncharacterized protein LOC127838976 isoform X1 n=1 Tax=Dreissena polymorpha TaxID=45954 RepID=UPI0022648858|nr:uncharacterized protein LOC127838976 isoform X1 [Dreissena polymorpha]XP_052223074.1 uncharacterized protein LOC127838976 isoform X2 [Dreissena polymorpha]
MEGIYVLENRFSNYMFFIQRIGWNHDGEVDITPAYQMLDQDTAGAFQNIPVPGNIMEFHDFLMNNNNNNLQHYIHIYHNAHQQLLEEFKNVRYNMAEMQQEIDSIKDTITDQHQLYQQLEHQQQTLNAEITALQDSICKQNTAVYNLQHSLSSPNFAPHEISRHQNSQKPASNQHNQHDNHCNHPDAYNMINEDNNHNYQLFNLQSYLTPSLSTYSMNQAQEEPNVKECYVEEHHCEHVYDESADFPSPATDADGSCDFSFYVDCFFGFH